MVRNPSLRKIINLIQLAKVANAKSLSSGTADEIREELQFRQDSSGNASSLHPFNSSLHSHAVDSSRRNFLKIGAQAAAVLPFSALMAKQALGGLVYSRTLGATSSPVVILGGGVAGLVAAYRLLQADVPCVLYEGSDRFGGRVFTHSNFNSEGMFCELGGELVDTDHVDLIQLCAELGVGIQELDTGDRGFQAQLFYSDGRLRSEKEMLEAFRPLALHITKDLVSLFGSDEVRVPTFQDADNPEMVKFDRMTLEAYLDSKTNVEKWARDLIGVVYVCEFGRELGEQSALNFLTLISADASELKLLGSSDECKRIQGGSSALPNALYRAIEGRVPVYPGHPLVKIKDNGTRFKLTLMKGYTPVEITAQNVICTIPFSVLRDIEGICELDLNPTTLSCIQTLGYGTNSKLMTGYTKRIWRDAKFNSNGAVVTNSQQQFWETSRMQNGSGGVITQFLGGNLGNQIPMSHLNASLQCLESIFPGMLSAHDGKQILQHWPSNPWSKGSYTCPMPGQYTSIYGAAAEPALSGRLLFAGEHTSVESCGFMNGAVQTGNLAAQKLVGTKTAAMYPSSFFTRRNRSQQSNLVAV